MKEPKSNVDADVGSAEEPGFGKEKDVGRALCVGIDSKDGRAHKRTYDIVFRPLFGTMKNMEAHHETQARTRFVWR